MDFHCITDCFSLQFDTMDEYVNRFALDLYQSCEPGENIVFSPFVIFLALGAIYIDTNGNTAKQIATALHFDNVDHLSVVRYVHGMHFDTNCYGFLTSANGIFTPEGHIPYWPGLNLYQYFDFTKGPEVVREHINTWVADNTNRKFLNLLPPGYLTPLDSLLMINTAYFHKKMWMSHFKPTFGHFRLSSTELFYDHIPCLETRGIAYFVYDSSLKCKMVEMPFDNGDNSLYILLPDDVDGLSGIEDKLTIDILENMILRMNETFLDIKIPEFEISKTTEITEALKDLGIEDMFIVDKANFTGFKEENDIHVSKVIHAAAIEVNEEGTEAPAVIALLSEPSSIRPLTFEASHPFLFFGLTKYHKNSLIWSMGRFSKPN